MQKDKNRSFSQNVMCRKPKNLVFCPLWGWKRQKIPFGRVLQRCIFKKTEFGRVLQRCILTLSQVFYLLQRYILTITEVFRLLQRCISKKTRTNDILSCYLSAKIQFHKKMKRWRNRENTIEPKNTLKDRTDQNRRLFVQ